MPTPGDHYSPAGGSANVNRVYELCAEHERHGGEGIVVVGRGTRCDYEAGTCVAVDFPPFIHRWQRWTDAALGAARLPRRFASRHYVPVAEALGRDFAGCLFLYNDVAAGRFVRRACPRATLCIHMGNELGRSLSRAEVTAAIGCFDHVICNSAYLAQTLRQRVRGEPKHVSVILNGVNVEKFRPAVANGREQGAGEPDEPVILYVGRMVPMKGPDLLVRAAVLLRQRGYRFRLRLVGSASGSFGHRALTDYERDLRDLAAPIGDLVAFQPFVNRTRIVGEYQGAAIFCAPCRWNDPCPNTVLEAMACGLATVASNRGGVPELGEAALAYVEPTDIEGLADQLAAWLDDRALLRERGDSARQRALALSWSAQYRKLRSVVDG